MQLDGSLKGYVGGYRPWAPVYQSWVDARGPVIEELMWVRLPDIYYALQRYADYSPTGPKGEKTHISSALRIDAVPAFVMTPDAKDQMVAQVQSYKASAPKARRPPPTPADRGSASCRSSTGSWCRAGSPAVSQTAELLTPAQHGLGWPSPRRDRRGD